MSKKAQKFIALLLTFVIFLNALPLSVMAEFIPTSSSTSKKTDIKEETIQPKAGATKKDAKIVSEITSKRELNKKHYLMSDGSTMVAIYPGNVHYLDNGVLKDIDNTLVSKDDDYQNKSNNLNVTFSKKVKSNKMVTLKNKEFVLNWSLANASTTTATLDSNSKKVKIDKSTNKGKMMLDNLSSSLTYKDILDDTDLKYDVIGDQVKESIILNSQKAVTDEYSFNMDIKGLTAKAEDDNTIVVNGPDGKEKFIIEAPYMYDSNMEFNDKLKLSLEENTSGYIVKLHADKEWLTDKNRKFPVVIDPTISTSRNYQDIEDVYIYNNDSDNSGKGIAHILRVGNNTLSYTGGMPFRSLIKFTLPKLSAGDQIVDAALDIFNYPDDSDWNPPAGNIQVDVHKMTADWTETAAYWNNLKDSYDHKIVDYFMYGYTADNPMKDNYMNITSIVKDWYVTGNNYGLMLKEHNEGTVSGRQDMYFLSGDTNASYYYNYRPLATITYRNQTGLEDYLSYHEQTAGRAGKIYTNDYNGNVTLIHDDATTPGSRMPASIYHVYNTNDISDINNQPTNIGYGNGYRLNLSQTIELQAINNVNYAKYIDEDGTRHYFTKDGITNNYYDEDGLGLKLSLNNNIFVMEDKGGNKSTFESYNTYWRLKEIADSNNNKITVNYSEAVISGVADAIGDTLTLNYTNGLLSSIIDSNNRTTSYNYANNDLTSITYVDGKQAIYTYDNHLLKSVKNIDNSHIDYDYYSVSPYRLKTIKEYGTNNDLGNTMNMTYGENATKFSDNNNYSNTYNFNSYGNNLSVADFGKSGSPSEAYGQAYDYGTSGGTKNKLTLETKLIKPVINQVYNGNAENDGSWSQYQWGLNTGTMQIVSGTSYYGNRSFKVSTNTSDSVLPFYGQTLKLTKGKTYTVSGYIKTDNLQSPGGGGAILLAFYTDANGAIITPASPDVYGTNDWQKYSVTFDYPANAASDVTLGLAVRFSQGTAYFDAIQVEEGTIANNYNFFENAGFEYAPNTLNKWTGNAQVNSSIDKVVNVDNTNALKIVGDGFTDKNFLQIIDTSGNAGDIYNVSGWVKTNGLPNYGGRYSHFATCVMGSDGACDWEDLPITADSNNWQFISKQFITKKAYTKIYFYVTYYKNANDVYFDNLGLYKDESGNSYTYNKDGNIISSQDNAKNTDTFVISGNNELLSTVNPKGGSYTYEYDFNNKQRLLKATSGNNLKYSFSYDNYGNNTGIKVDSNIANSGVVSNKTYYIKSYNSGKYFDVRGSATTNGTSVDQFPLHGLNNQKFIVSSIGGDYYKIVTSLDTNKAITADVNGKAVVYDYSGSDSQKWKIIKNSDNTYKIVSTNNKILSIADSSLVNGVQLSLSDWAGLASQKVLFYEASTDDAFDDNFIESNEAYYIRVKSSNLYLDYEKDSTGNLKADTNGVRVVQRKFNAKSPSQLWRFVKTGNNAYKIIPLYSIAGRAIYVASSTDESDITMSDYVNDSAQQEWNLIKNDDGTYSINSKWLNNSKQLSVYWNSLAEEGKMCIFQTNYGDGQKFYLEKANLTDVTDGTYKIKNLRSNLYLGKRNNQDANGTIVEQQEAVDTLNQQWVFENLHNGYYKIRPKTTANNQILDVTGASTADGAIMQTYNEWGELSNFAQQFEIVSNIDGTVTIRPRLTFGRSAIDIPGASTAPGTYAQLWQSNGGVAQKFYLERVDTPAENGPYIESKAEYSTDGNFLTKITDSTGKDTEYLYNYDDTNKSGTLATTKDGKDNATSYNYDSLDRVTSVSKQASGNTYTNGYIYDNDRLTTINHNGFSYNFIYDSFGNAKEVKVGDATLVTNNYATNNGNLTSTTYGNNQTVSYEYDRFNRVTKKIQSNNTYEYGYDARGNIAYSKDNATRYDYKYDIADRILKVRGTNGYSTDYSYDSNSNVSKLTHTLWANKNTINYVYDRNSRISNVKYGSDLLLYNYDSLSRLDSNELKVGTNSYKTSYTYISDGNKTSTVLGSIKNGNSDEISYTYDANGNIETILVGGVEKAKYYYDELNQLIKEDNADLNRTIVYVYDLGGNITSKTEYEYKTETQLSTISYTYDSTWKDKLTSYNDKAITYDNIGNPLTYDGNTYEWVNGRQLASITNGSNVYQYKYDDNGIRTEKIVNGVSTKYYTNGSKVIYETTGNNTIYYLYDSNDNVIGLKYNNSTYYYIKNGQNDIIGLLDGNLNQVVSYTYDSGGKLISVKDSNNNEITDASNIGLINPYRYRSYRYDNETGLYYLNSRYYTSEWGRFISSDSGLLQDKTILGNNLYLYVGNNPINRFDPDGYFWKEIGNFFKGIGVSIKKAATAVKNAFVFEAGAGLGLGASGQVGALKIQGSGYKDFGFGIKNGKKYDYTTTSAAVKIEVTKKIKAGVGIEVNHINSYNEPDTLKKNNPMAMPWEVWNSPHTSKSLLMGVDYKEYGGVEASNDGVFIGISLDLHLVVGGHIKIGFNVK